MGAVIQEKIVFLFAKILKMGKIYTKVNEMSFKVEETKTLSDTIDVTAQFEMLAQNMGRLKSIVAQAQKNRDLVSKTVEWYNTWVDILNEAKETCHLAYNKLDPIVLPDEWTVENLDIEKRPKINIKRDENEQAE